MSDEIQHKDLPEDQLHEPKHIQASNTADHGKVITPHPNQAATSILAFAPIMNNVEYITAIDNQTDPETQTWEVPEDVYRVIFFAQGAGGSSSGGRAREGSGAAGGLAIKVVDTQPGEVFTVLVGRAPRYPASSSTRLNGELTYVEGPGMSRISGHGGESSTNNLVDNRFDTRGGEAHGGDINITGEPGTAVLTPDFQGDVAIGGKGGSSFFGAGGRLGNNISVVPSPTSFGCGKGPGNGVSNTTNPPPPFEDGTNLRDQFPDGVVMVMY